MKRGHRLKSLVLPAGILAVWWLGSAARLWNAYILPGPGQVWRSFIAMARSGELTQNIAASLARVGVGFAIAFVLAFLLGTLAGVLPRLTVWYDPVVEFLRHVPPLSLIPLLILWFGIGETSKIIIIVLASFFPMFLDIRKGFARCDRKLLEVGRTLGLSGRARFFRIMLPCAFPDILVGMRIGLGYSWRAIIGAEMIAAASGLGYMILDAQQLSRSDKVIVGILVIGIVGCLCDFLLDRLIARLVRGGVRDGGYPD